MSFLGVISSCQQQLAQSLGQVMGWLARPDLQPKAPRPIGLDMTRLEERVLLSAAPFVIDLATLGADPVDVEPSQAIPAWQPDSTDDDGDFDYVESPNEQSDGRQLVFVDRAAADYEQLMEDLLQPDDGAADYDVYRIDGDANGVEQITSVLQQYSNNVTAIHLVSHGSGTGILLGDSWLSSDSLGDFGNQLANWQEALRSDADVLIYGCDLASTSAGRSLIRSIGELCECDVAASDDATGHESLGGDWDLEYVLGDIENSAPFSATLQESWVGQLDITTVTTTLDVVDGNVSSISDLNFNPGMDNLISLREAIIAANSGSGADEINLPAGTFSLSLTGAGEDVAATGDLDVSDDVTINGAGSAGTIINGQGADRVFHFFSGSSTLRDLTVTGGSSVTMGGGILTEMAPSLILDQIVILSNSASAEGGGLHNSGTAVLTDVAVRNNSLAAGDGGGIYNRGNLTLDRVTVSGNSAQVGAGIFQVDTAGISFTNATISNNVAGGDGGGIYSDTAISLTNTTVAGNSAGGSGGGLYATSTGNFSLRNTLLADNLVGGMPDNVQATSPLVSLGFNVDTDGTAGLTGTGDQSGTVMTPLDAGLQILSDNGGFVDTQALDSDSPALNAGGNMGAATVDARGVARDEIPDVGSFESELTAGKIYFVDASDDELIRVNTDGSAKQTLLTGLSAPGGTAVDLAGGKIYWSNQGTGTIQRADLDGTNLETLISSGLDSPRGIDLDLVNGKIYIADDGSADDILWADLDGSNLETIVGNAGSAPAGITVDPVGEKIYWGNVGFLFGDIRTADLDGDSDGILVAGQLGPTSVDLDLTNGHVYWTDDSGIGNDDIKRANLNGSSVVTVFNDDFTSPFGIALDVANSKIYWSESFGNELKSVNYDGSGETTLVSGQNSARDLEFISLSSPPNNPPTLTAFASTVDSTAEETEVEITFGELAAEGDENDTDGSVVAFIVQSVSTGSLRIGPNAGMATNFVAGSNDRVDATNNAYWTPDNNDNGDQDAFDVVVEDNDGALSTGSVTAQVNVTPVNDPPTLTAFAGVVETTMEDTEAEIRFSDLVAEGDEADVDGTVDAFIVQSVSTGILRIGSSPGSATPFAPGSNDRIDSSDKAYWTPAQEATGDQNAFAVVAEDNQGARSVGNVIAQVNVTSVNDPPTLTAFAGVVETTLEDTEVEIRFSDLAAKGNEADVDGTVDAFIVQSVSTGTLRIGTSPSSATPFAAGSNDRIDSSNKAFWTPDPDANGDQDAFAVVAEDNQGARSMGPVTAKVGVTAQNDRPKIANLASDTLTYNEGDSAAPIEQAGDATVSDVDSSDFLGGKLTVSIVAGGVNAEDTLSIRHQGTGPEQNGFSDGDVTYGNVLIGTASGGANGVELKINFTTPAATAAATQQLIKNITYVNGDANNPTAGSRTVRFSVTDGDGGTSANQDATVMVNAMNDPPQITTPPGPGVAENTTFVLNVTATDPEMDPVTFAIVGGEDAASFTIVAATGKLLFLIAPDFENPNDDDANNIYEVEVLATDGLADDKQLLQISVSDQNDAPTVNNDSIQLDQNTSVSVSAPGVLANDSDQDLDPLSVLVATGPVNGTLMLGVDGSFIYTPDSNFFGTDTFTYEASDGSATSTGSVTVTVVEASPMPVLPPAPGPVPEEPPEEIEEEEQTEEIQSGDGEVVDNEPVAAPVSGRRDQPSGQRPGDLPFTGREPVRRTSPVSRGFLTAVPIAEQRLLRLPEAGEEVERESFSEVPAESLVDLSYVAQTGSYLWDEMDELAEELNSVAEIQEIIVAGTTTITTSLTVGYVVWLLRGGQLLTSLLAQMPAWRFMQLDALAILDEASTKIGDDDEDDSVESLVENARRKEEERLAAEARLLDPQAESPEGIG